MPVSIAQSIGLQDSRGGPLLEHLSGYVGDRKLLLVLDNFEHLLSAGEFVQELLAGSTQLRILVTSRSPLHLSGEQEFPVPALRVPEPGPARSVISVAACESAQLFAVHARRLGARFHHRRPERRGDRGDRGATRRRDFAILRALGFTPWQVRRTLCWQAVTLAGIALVIGVPAGVACGGLCWQLFAHQLGITPVVAVPLTALFIMAGWLAAAAVIAALPGEAATRNSPGRVLHSE